MKLWDRNHWHCSIRDAFMLQWLLGSDTKSTSYIGCVGKFHLSWLKHPCVESGATPFLSLLLFFTFFHCYCSSWKYYAWFWRLKLNLLTGKDEFGKILAEKAKEAGVHVNYLIHDKESTGTCAVCITGKHRYLFYKYWKVILCKNFIIFIWILIFFKTNLT